MLTWHGKIRGQSYQTQEKRYHNDSNDSPNVAALTFFIFHQILSNLIIHIHILRDVIYKYFR